MGENNTYIEYIRKSIEELQEQEKSLIADDRKDEANLMKIRINVYGIAKSFYETVQKICPGEGFAKEYRNRVSRLPQNWKQSLEQARTHEDVEKTVIEEVKITTMEEILKVFEEEQI